MTSTERRSGAPADRSASESTIGDTGTRSPEHLRELLASLLVIAWFVEARDPYTGGHLWRVSRYAGLLASSAGLGARDVARVAVGGFLHDIGKVGVPDAILRKTGALAPDEYAVMQTHPEIGVRMLAGHPLAGLVHNAVADHHERIDGAGYPRGVPADDIGIDARIISICDSFDAMTSARPFRSGLPRDVALQRIGAGLDRQFDRALGERFIAMGRDGTLDEVIGHSDDEIPLEECPVCGPTLVVRRGQRAGEHAYCRNCANEFELHSRSGRLRPEPTGRRGDARALQPQADEVLIARAVDQTAAALLESATPTRPPTAAGPSTA